MLDHRPGRPTSQGGLLPLPSAPHPVDIAINHLYTKHLYQSVWDADLIQVTENRPVGLVWLSPDCKHFSKAKGGTPVSRHIGGLAWVRMCWMALTKSRVLMLENVEGISDLGAGHRRH